MFGRHSSNATVPADTVGDERADNVVDDQDNTVVTEATAEARQDDAARVAAADQAAADRDAADQASAAATAQREDAERAAADQAAADRAAEEKAADDKAADDVVEPVSTRWAHVSLLASLSFFLGTLAVAATLTGLLAPLGFAAGIVAVVLGALASLGVRRRNVTGHGLVTFGILFGLIAIILSVLAMAGDLSWLSNKTDEIATVHNWLNDHFHWLRRW
jgi:hypothetical protein